MQIRKLDHVGIRVMTFERSLAFYRALGFEVVRDDRAEHVVVIRHPSGVELNLLDSGDDDHGGSNVLMDAHKRYPGYTHYAIEVDSVADAKTFFEGLGVAVTQGPVRFSDGKTSIFVRDPDSNVIEFTQLPDH